MINKPDKNALRIVRHHRVRNRVAGTAERPRLNVYRSTNEIYCQVINDVSGTTLASASTMEPDVRKEVAEMTKTQAAELVGKRIAARAKAVDVTTVVFDRGGYLYTGRVEALAKGAREGGLEF